MKANNPFTSFIRCTILCTPLLLLAFTTGDTKSEYALSRAAYSVYSTDFNLNNHNDLIIGHKTASGDSNITVSVLSNDTNGNFIIDTTLTFCGYQENIFAIKLNGDEYPDLVTFYSDFSSGTVERYIRIYVNFQGSLGNHFDYSLNSSSTFSTINYGDIDGNDFEDILVVSNNDQFWGILYNDGLGNFSEPEYHNVYDYFPSGIDCGDLNGDGRDDIVICGQSTEVYFSYPGNFQKLTLESEDFKDNVILSDFDMDDDLDIVTFVDLYIVNYTRIKIYENIGGNSFDTIDNFDFQPACNDFFIADFNADTFPDILFHTLDNTGALIFYNLENFQISDPQIIDIPDYGETFRKGISNDLDNNGYNDIIILRYHYSPLSNNLSILFNDGNGNFQEDPITGIQTSNFKPQTSSLSCYPNPFNSTTQIWYKLEDESTVTVDVFDYTGKKIRKYNQGTIDKGSHFFEFASKGLSAGIYFYSLEVNGKVTDSKKMTLMK